MRRDERRPGDSACNRTAFWRIMIQAVCSARCCVPANRPTRHWHCSRTVGRPADCISPPPRRRRRTRSAGARHHLHGLFRRHGDRPHPALRPDPPRDHRRGMADSGSRRHPARARPQPVPARRLPRPAKSSTTASSPRELVLGNAATARRWSASRRRSALRARRRHRHHPRRRWRIPGAGGQRPHAFGVGYVVENRHHEAARSVRPDGQAASPKCRRLWPATAARDDRDRRPAVPAIRRSCCCPPASSTPPISSTSSWRATWASPLVVGQDLFVEDGAV